jgi:hypothetical protein
MTSQAATALACLAAGHSVRTMVLTCIQHDQIEFIFFPSLFRYTYTKVNIGCWLGAGTRTAGAVLRVSPQPHQVKFSHTKLVPEQEMEQELAFLGERRH